MTATKQRKLVGSLVVRKVLTTPIIALAAILALAISGCSSNSSSQSAGTPAATASSSTPRVVNPGGPIQGATTTCTYTPTGSGSVSLPPSKTKPTTLYTATMRTSQGNIVIKLLNSQAPCTVNSFVHLAEANFWNDTQCHRISDSEGLYMLQCGDPTAKASETLSCSSATLGTGGPGYQFNDENLTGATYKAGTVAMANAGPNTNGSQFFLVFQDTELSPSYTPFGTITSGLAILQKVARAGTTCVMSAGGGVPKDKVIINSVTITKG
jgi:peptidyl-prolyl cis-trans isomerase B (cyclophilin B)